jgi:hypothetical protein
MFTLHFHKTNTPIGKSIRVVTRGRVNHVSIEINNTVYESDMKKGGCVKTDSMLFDRSTIVESITFTGGNESVVLWLEKQLGKGYDYLGVLSFLWILLPERKGKWYCSEKGMVALAKYLGLSVYNQKQSPNDLLILAKQIKQFYD